MWRSHTPLRLCGKIESQSHLPNSPLNPPNWGTLSRSEVPQFGGFRGQIEMFHRTTIQQLCEPMQTHLLKSCKVTPVELPMRPSSATISP
jgi:hypothetical protein